ncbi:MAG: hypothetical protein EBT51_11945 [Flavobacteriaceae bacterium]|nr:hypothetical protein [Flavobacteriaceae bacterium]
MCVFNYSVNINKKIDIEKLFGNFFATFLPFFDFLATGGPPEGLRMPPEGLRGRPRTILDVPGWQNRPMRA